VGTVLHAAQSSRPAPAGPKDEWVKSEARGQLPLAAAAERLRRPPGRPRKVPQGERAQAIEANALPFASNETGSCRTPVPGLCPLTPRLLDLQGAAGYLAVSPWTIRDLEAAGILPRVRVPLPGGRDLRRLLFDREDLDRVIARWKDSPPVRL